MDKLSHYRQIIHQILTPYSQIIYNNADIQNRLAFDTQNDQYLVISEGWQHTQRYHDCLIHLEIINENYPFKMDRFYIGIHWIVTMEPVCGSINITKIFRK